MQQTNTISKNIEKSKLVNNLFNRIAYKYDLLNRLMTFGQHKKWKEYAIKLALKELKHLQSVLDICTGTGDLLLLINKHCKNCKITGIDNSESMLDIAKRKTIEFSNISVRLEDFEGTESINERYDLITISFGLRNLTKQESSINKIYKTLNQNGVFVCIDLGYPKNILWRNIFFFYFFNIVPILGQIFAGDREAYSYLPNSLHSWYKQEDLKELLLKTGFKKCFYKNIFGGVITIHIGVK